MACSIISTSVPVPCFTWKEIILHNIIFSVKKRYLLTQNRFQGTLIQKKYSDVASPSLLGEFDDSKPMILSSYSSA